MAYKPTDGDREFARKLCQMMKDGGRWIWPVNGMMYRFNKRARTMTLLNRETLSDPANLYGHQQTQIIFATAGFEVI